MTQFRRYEHLERLGHVETRDIEIGRVHLFPKLDGTNGSVWYDESGKLQCASRNRVLSADADNQGFHAWLHSDDVRACALRSAVPVGSVVYGEWLVPHTIKTYRDEAWKRFWIFDVFHRESGRFLRWDDYGPQMAAAGCDVIEPLCVITNPSTDQLIAQLATNTYLVQDGAGVGEGVVLKNYDWQNEYGRQPWAKLVRSEFKEQNRRAFGTTEKGGEFQIEIAIAEEFVTATLVGKTRAKVVEAVANHHKIDLTAPNAQRLVEVSFRHNVIPQLLGRVLHDFVTEELWAAIKQYRNPAIDFGKLCRLVERRTKSIAQDLFGGVAVAAGGLA